MLFSLLSLQILANLTLISHTNFIVRTSTYQQPLGIVISLIMSSLILLLLLSLSINASNARQLGVIRKEPGKQVYLFGEDVERTKLLESRGGTNMMKQKDSKALLIEDETKVATSGSARSEIIVPSSKEGLQQATKIEGWKRQARALLGSAPHDAEETVNSKEPGDVAEIVVTDYAQPHRKPPIHNEEP